MWAWNPLYCPDTLAIPSKLQPIILDSWRWIFLWEQCRATFLFYFYYVQNYNWTLPYNANILSWAFQTSFSYSKSSSFYLLSMYSKKLLNLRDRGCACAFTFLTKTASKQYQHDVSIYRHISPIIIPILKKYIFRPLHHASANEYALSFFPP